MTQTLFTLTFLLAAPFWALMILLPGWRRTQSIIASPLIAVPPLLIYLMVMIPIFPQFWAAVSAPGSGRRCARCCPPRTAPPPSGRN